MQIFIRDDVLESARPIYADLVPLRATSRKRRDLLVQYDPDASVGLLAMGGHLMDFQDIIGRKVDLTPNGLCKYIRDDVLESARPIESRHALILSYCVMIGRDEVNTR